MAFHWKEWPSAEERPECHLFPFFSGIWRKTWFNGSGMWITLWRWSFMLRVILRPTNEEDWLMQWKNKRLFFKSWEQMKNTADHLTVGFPEKPMLLSLLKHSIKNMYLLSELPYRYISTQIFSSRNFQLQFQKQFSDLVHFYYNYLFWILSWSIFKSSVWWDNRRVLGAHICRQLTTKSIYSKTFHTYNGQNVFPLGVLSACNMPQRGPDNGPFHRAPCMQSEQRCIMGA